MPQGAGCGALLPLCRDPQSAVCAVRAHGVAYRRRRSARAQVRDALRSLPMLHGQSRMLTRHKRPTRGLLSSLSEAERQRLEQSHGMRARTLATIARAAGGSLDGKRSCAARNGASEPARRVSPRAQRSTRSCARLPLRSCGATALRGAQGYATCRRPSPGVTSPCGQRRWERPPSSRSAAAGIYRTAVWLGLEL